MLFQHVPINMGKSLVRNWKTGEKRGEINKEGASSVSLLNIFEIVFLTIRIKIQTIGSFRERETKGKNSSNTQPMGKLEIKVTLNHQPNQITPVKNQPKRNLFDKKKWIEVLSGPSTEWNIKHRGTSRNVVLNWSLEIEFLPVSIVFSRGG